MAAKRTPDQDKAFNQAVKDLEQDLVQHSNLVTKFDERYRAYRGVIKAGQMPVTGSKLQHPAVVLQSVETMIASLVDPSPKWRLRACPIIDDQEHIETLREGARANELLLSHQLTVDKYAEKQRPYDLQNLILGVTGSKERWLEKKGPRHRLVTVDEPVYGAFDQQIGVTSKLVEGSQEVVYRDDPTTEVVDMRDLILPENATSVANCARIQHRMWFSYDELLELQDQGVYGSEAGGEDVALVKDGQGFSSEMYQRESDLFDVKRTKDLIEVVECWTDRGKKVVTIANRRVLLGVKDNPFWFEHLDHPYPFTVCSSMPDLFRIPGISEVELMAELQEMLWTLMNSRLDALQLLSQPIFMIADDVEDPDAFEFGPAERWLVPRPVTETVKQWSPDPNVPRMTIEAEELLLGQLQNVTGGMPFLSGTNSQSVDQSTATGVSIITSLAQKRLAAKKQTLIWAKGRIGEHWCALNQQFVRGERMVPVVGRDGVEQFQKIRPEMIQGAYSFQVEQVDESLMRQEKRAEAQAKMQTLFGIAQPAALLGVKINPKAIIDDYLEAFDVIDKERYYSAAPPPPVEGSAQPAQAPASPSGNGVTSALATAPQAPSNDTSMSPAVFSQRMLAGTGPTQ